MPQKNYRNQEQDRRLDAIEGSIKVINEEMGDVKIEMAQIKTDICWLKQHFWIVTTASVSAMIMGLINLLFKG